MEKLLLSAEDVAEALTISRTRVYEILAAGELFSVRLGKVRRIPRESLAEYIEKLRTEEVA
jgi:excisionase family DNA binding protein